MDTLPFSRLHEAGDDTVGLESLFGSRSETHLSEDDHLAQRLLGMVVCRGHAGDTEKGEEVSLLRADEIPSQGFSRLETQGLFTGGRVFPCGWLSSGRCRRI
jgi:hypothetical protein